MSLVQNQPVGRGTETNILDSRLYYNKQFTTFHERIWRAAQRPGKRRQHHAVCPLPPTQCCCRYPAACNADQQANPAHVLTGGILSGGRDSCLSSGNRVAIPQYLTHKQPLNVYPIRDGSLGIKIGMECISAARGHFVKYA